jgi:hypothetical protein
MTKINPPIKCPLKEGFYNLTNPLDYNGVQSKPFVPSIFRKYKDIVHMNTTVFTRIRGAIRYVYFIYDKYSFAPAQ